MGLARGAIRLLLDEAAREPFSGTLLTLGRQAVQVDGGQLARLFSERRMQPRGPIADGPLDDNGLFTALGFDAVESLDYSDYEGATHVFDLNRPDLPDALGGRYDVVLDSGTIEHVFHLPNALKNVVGLVKVGGRIILQTPSSNHFDHGFYMFSPTLFVDYFAANALTLATIYVVRYSPDPAALWDVYRYQPRTWDALQCGGLDGNPYLLFIVATKTAQSTGNAIPQQGLYGASSSLYRGSTTAGSQSAAPAGAEHEQSRAKKLARDLLARMPLADRLARRMARRIRKTLLTKERVARV